MSVSRVDLNKEQEAHAQTRLALEASSAREAALRATVKDLHGEIMSLKQSADQARVTGREFNKRSMALAACGEALAKALQRPTEKDLADVVTRARDAEVKAKALGKDLASAKALALQSEKALAASEDKAAALVGKVERAELEKQACSERLDEASKEINLLKEDCALKQAEVDAKKSSADETILALQAANSRERALKSELANLKARQAVSK